MRRYDSQWQGYRRLRLLSLLFVLPFCAMPLVLVFHISPQLLLFSMPFGFIGAGAWFVLNFFRCPRCGRFFAMTFWYNLSIFARRCVHCGLKKFSDAE
jgi:hypothetical protein